MTTPIPPIPRAELLRQATHGNPWQFIAAWEPRLHNDPADLGEFADELRVLAAHALGKVGLTTLVLQHLRNLGPVAAARRGVPETIRAAETRKSDVIPDATRIATCRKNLAAITNRDQLPPELDGSFQDWIESSPDAQAFRTLSGSPVLRRRIDGRWFWTHFCDQHSMAATFVQGELPSGPLIVDGLYAPLVIERLIGLTPRSALGVETRITLLADSPTELFDSLSLHDLSAVLALPRVHLIVGPQTPARLDAYFRARIEQPLGTLVALPSPPPVPGRSPQDALGGVLQPLSLEQQRLQALSRQELAEVYSECDAGWWARRFDATGESSSPLRVLIPTTRFSTFLQHSAADIAEAFNHAGCDARVFIEPDDCTAFSNLTLAREIKDFRPDLMVLINCTRTHYHGVIPAPLPVVTWVQDTMPQLFDAGAGGGFGVFDFVVGHPHREFFQHFNYPGDRMLHTPVVASARKFRPEPAARDLLDKHACEIAYVSHQGESPEQCRDRVIKAATGSVNSWIVPMLEEAYDTICAVATSRVVDGHMDARIRQAVLDATRRALGDDPCVEQFTMAHYAIARPIAERANRHQMVSWAADLCRRRNWRLHLYGRHWTRTPEFAPFAKGPLEHGEELRASYQAATIHLQGGLAGVLHQRVIECALSGGLPLIRLSYDAFDSIECLNAVRLTLDHVPPSLCTLPDRTPWISPADHPDSAAIVRLRQLLGLPELPGVQVYPGFLAPEARFERAQALQREAVWLLGDCTQSVFDTPARLEQLVENAIEMPQWRQQLSSGIRARARAALTYDSTLDRLLTMIRRELAESAASPSTAVLTPAADRVVAAGATQEAA